MTTPGTQTCRAFEKTLCFLRSDAGAKALAIHTSLVASAKRNGLNPVEYLADVFARINDMKTSELHQLLPDRWEQIRKPINTVELQDSLPP
jgi:transposase